MTHRSLGVDLPFVDFLALDAAECLCPSRDYQRGVSWRHEGLVESGGMWFGALCFSVKWRAIESVFASCPCSQFDDDLFFRVTL